MENKDIDDIHEGAHVFIGDHHGIGCCVVDGKKGHGKEMKIAVKCDSDEDCHDLKMFGLDIHELMKNRSNVVMTRVNDDDLEIIDLLVDSGAFESRSVCAAFLIHEGIEARKDVVGKVKETVKQIRDLKKKIKKDLS
jgi:hypothetical protein